ncbi:uncharacterized protein DS421_9g264320 [Arachis hypogaea]|nr:uncharacterized protein DS421_9g264320 [Arachis hypogaea]
MNGNGEEEMSDDKSNVKTLEEEMRSGDESKEKAREFVQGKDDEKRRDENGEGGATTRRRAKRSDAEW